MFRIYMQKGCELNIFDLLFVINDILTNGN